MKEKAKATAFYKHFSQMVMNMDLVVLLWLVPIPILLSKVTCHWTSHCSKWSTALLLSRGCIVQDQSKQAPASSRQSVIHVRLLKAASDFRCYSYFQCHQPLPALLWVFVWISCSQSAWWHLWACRNQTSHQAQIPKYPWLAVKRKCRYFVTSLFKSNGILQLCSLSLHGRYDEPSKGCYLTKQPLEHPEDPTVAGEQEESSFYLAFSTPKL